MREAGHHAVGLDGAEKLCQLARDHSNCQVAHADLRRASSLLDTWSEFDGARPRRFYAPCFPGYPTTDTWSQEIE